MANRDSIYVYRLSDKGRKIGIHTICTPPDKEGPGRPFKIGANGIVKIPHPGLPHCDAHHLTLVDVEGGGGSDLVDPELVELHQAIADAEKIQGDAAGVVNEAKKAVDGAKNAEAKKAAAEQLKEAEALFEQANEGVLKAKKAAEGRF